MTGAVAAEIRASEANGTYTVLFSVHAPDPEKFASALVSSGAATIQATKSEQQATSDRNARDQLWNVTLTQEVDPFAACFELALANDSTVSETFPMTAAFLRVGSQIAKRAAATRKVNAARKTPTTTIT